MTSEFDQRNKGIIVFLKISSHIAGGNGSVSLRSSLNKKGQTVQRENVDRIY